MLQFSELHPYNATHTYKIAGPLCLERLREAIVHTFGQNGLGVVELSPDGVSYRHLPDSGPELEVLPGGDAPEAVLSAYVSRELNHRFERPRCRPLRFGVVDGGPQAHWITATYDHWIADATAARLILRQILGRYCGLELPENNRPLEFFEGTYRQAFASRLRGPKLVGILFRAILQRIRNGAAAQVPYSSMMQMGVGFELYHTAPGTVDRLRAFARSQGATVHDVILAALGQALVEVLPRRSARRTLALGTIVDTRSEADVDLSQTLGTFLGYFLTRMRPRPGEGLDALVRRVAAVTGPIKARHRYLDTMLGMKLTSFLWLWLREKARPYFMRRAIPLTGGVSNVVLRDTWIDRPGSPIVEYVRGAPTGPMLPLVLTPTTVGDRMTVGLSYRITGLSRAKIDALMARFLAAIEHPADRAGLGGTSLSPSEGRDEPANHALRLGSGTCHPSV
jgi:hypothetical protein